MLRQLVHAYSAEYGLRCSLDDVIAVTTSRDTQLHYLSAWLHQPFIHPRLGAHITALRAAATAEPT